MLSIIYYIKALLDPNCKDHHFHETKEMPVLVQLGLSQLLCRRLFHVDPYIEVVGP